MCEFRVCRKCGLEKPLESFVKVKWGDGFGYTCKNCINCIQNERRYSKGKTKQRQVIVTETEKECLGCKTLKLFCEFDKCKAGRLGLQTYCRQCKNERRQNNQDRDREKLVERAIKWRKENPERVKATTRIHNFKRNKQQRVSDDGTITDEFLRVLYATERCFYCEEITPKNKRTLDHKTPLIRGGAHSADNAVMACRSCNSKKSRRTMEEYVSLSREAA